MTVSAHAETKALFALNCGFCQGVAAPFKFQPSQSSIFTTSRNETISAACTLRNPSGLSCLMGNSAGSTKEDFQMEGIDDDDITRFIDPKTQSTLVTSVKNHTAIYSFYVTLKIKELGNVGAVKVCHCTFMKLTETPKQRAPFDPDKYLKDNK